VMTAKEYLRQYEELNKRALRYKAEYEKEAELIDAVRSPQGGDGMPHGSGISRVTEDRAIRLSDKRMRWIEAELDAIEKRQEVFDVIDRVPGIEGTLLYERYINLKSWEQVAEAIDRSDKWCRTRLHSNALQIVKIILHNSL